MRRLVRVFATKAKPGGLVEAVTGAVVYDQIVHSDSDRENRVRGYHAFETPSRLLFCVVPKD